MPIKPKLPKDTTFDKVLAWYLDDTGRKKLTKKQEEIRDRWEVAYDLMCTYHSPRQATAVLEKKYGYSKAQAYRDIKNATDLFGDIASTSREGLRNILFEYAMKVFQLAATAKDLTEMNRAVANMIKLKGLDRDDPNMPDPEKMMPQQQVIQLSPEFLKKYADMLDEKVIKNMRKALEQKVFHDYKDVMAEDIPFVEDDE